MRIYYKLYVFVDEFTIRLHYIWYTNNTATQICTCDLILEQEMRVLRLVDELLPNFWWFRICAVVKYIFINIIFKITKSNLDSINK